MPDSDNIVERYTEITGRLPKGWVVYVENPLTSSARIVTCPLNAAPAWVQRKHANEDPSNA